MLKGAGGWRASSNPSDSGRSSFSCGVNKTTSWVFVDFLSLYSSPQTIFLLYAWQTQSWGEKGVVAQDVEFSKLLLVCLLASRSPDHVTDIYLRRAWGTGTQRSSIQFYTLHENWEVWGLTANAILHWYSLWTPAPLTQEPPFMCLPVCPASTLWAFFSLPPSWTLLSFCFTRLGMNSSWELSVIYGKGCYKALCRKCSCLVT